MNTEGKYIANKRVKHPYSWAKTTVYQILSNPVYLGKLVSQRYTTRSFKDKRIVERPPEEWVIVENTHEPLVDQATFDTVQERIKIKQPATWTNTDNMFRGLMICGGCNTRMVFTTRKNRKSKGHFSCNTHRRYGGKKCSSHYIMLEQVTELLLGDIQKHAALAAADHDAYKVLVQMENDYANQEKWQSYAKNNDWATFMLLFEKDFPNMAADRYEQNDQFFRKLFDDPDMMQQVMETVGSVLYERLKKKYIFDPKSGAIEEATPETYVEDTYLTKK